MNILIYDDAIESIAELVTAAREIAQGGNVEAIVINDESLAGAVAEKGLTVCSVSLDEFNPYDLGAVASVIAQCAENEGCDTVVLSSSRKGRAVAGLVAQRIGAGCLTNVNSIEIEDGKAVCYRNALGGAVVAGQRAAGDKQVIAISPKSYEAAGAAEGGSVKAFTASAESTGITHVETLDKEGSGVDITEADTLIVVGCGIEDKTTLAVVNQVASKLDGLVGCTKPIAVDREWFSQDCVVGISGKTCKPTLALLFGVSGQVQFYAGIRDAKVIAAVNTDEAAPIASMTDYMLVGDAVEALNDLAAAL